MLFLLLTPVLIRYLWQLKTVSCFLALVSNTCCSISNKFCKYLQLVRARYPQAGSVFDSFLINC